MYKAVSSVVVVAILIASSILSADCKLKPGNLEKVVEIKQRSLITIYTKEGDKQECRYWKIGRLRLGNVDFEDGRNGDLISESKGVGCINIDDRFVQMPLELIDVITLTEDISGVENIVYISEEVAKNHLVSPKSLLDWDHPVPGSWEKITRGYYYPRSTVFTKDGGRIECENTVISPMFVSPTSTDDSGEIQHSDSRIFKCINVYKRAVQIDTATIDKVTAVDYFSGTHKTVYISKERAMKEVIQ